MANKIDARQPISAVGDVVMEVVGGNQVPAPDEPIILANMSLAAASDSDDGSGPQTETDEHTVSRQGDPG